MYIYASNRNRCCFSEKLCVLASRLALQFCIIGQNTWAAGSQSPYLLFECDTAHVSQEGKAPQLSTVVPVVT